MGVSPVKDRPDGDQIGMIQRGLPHRFDIVGKQAGQNIAARYVARVGEFGELLEIDRQIYILSFGARADSEVETPR